MSAKSYPVPVSATSDLEAARKVAALTKLAHHLDVESLALLAGAAAKPGAAAKLKQFKSFL